MWENESRKIIIRNVILFILLVAAAAGLFLAKRIVQKRINAEDALLQEESANQRQELNEARKEKLEALQQAYEKDLETVREYLPGIVCWGDSLTAGSSGNVSYPGTLQKYIDAYLCDIYNFASTIEGAGGYPQMDWSKFTVSIPVVNMGSGRESSATILGRSGVSPYVIGKKVEIPAEVESVEIVLKSPDGYDVTPLTAGNAGLNPVVIEGVEGTITRENNGYKNVYRFTRTEPGEAVTVEKGAEVQSASVDAYRDYLHIVWLGTYDSFTRPEKLVSDTKALLSRQANNPERYLVLGPCAINGSWSTTSTTMDNIDSAMQQTFGNHYINVRKYLMTDGMTDAGLSMTKNDSMAVSQGKIPESFRSNASGADLNSVAYKLIGKLVYGRMDALGFFDEIRQELGLEKTAQELLKNNPKYFETILNAS